MRIPILVGVSLLAAVTALSAQAPPVALGPSTRLTLKFVNARFVDAVAAVADKSGVTVQLDDSVTPDLRERPLAYPIISVASATIEEVLSTLMNRSGCTYVVVDAKTIRIKANPR